ncbi:MAG: efflux RND transporter periplasmic adaptor subunit [Methylophilaceae bacterium]
MKRIHVFLIVILLLTGLAAGWYFWQQSRHAAMSSPPASGNGVVQDNSGKTVRYWYDPMVPTQKFDRPGKSPFMDMQLQPKYAGDDMAEGDSTVAISAQAMQNLGIRLAKAEMIRLGDALAAVGRIEPDERRFYAVQARIPGFVERLLVRAVGDPVKRGQKVAEVYAPELLGAQQEYLALLSLGATTGDDLKQAARQRLKLLGMSEGEIAGITSSGQASPRYGIYAPASGVLAELGVREGAQLMPGSSLMQISDLSSVWLIAEVPERDAARFKLGSTAEVQLQGMGGQPYTGQVSYIYPVLDQTSRTLRVRIQLANLKGELRPGMYANVSLAGEARQVLAVPTESIIATGKRKLVIVKEEHGFRPVEVVTGQEGSGKTEILKGLAEGENVVASGQFLIDSEASLSGVLARLELQSATDSMQAGAKTPAKMPIGTGKVVEVDAKANHVTLAHEPIPALGWPSMTMGFGVKDAQQLKALKPGDQVEFELKAQDDEYVIERIEKRGAVQ